MKKRFMMLLLVMVMVLATACGGNGDSGNTSGGEADGPTPFARLEAANSAYDEADSMVADFLVEMDMKLDGDSFMKYIMSGEIAMDAEDESDIRFSMKTLNDVTTMGQNQTMEMDAYYLDGYYYISMMGMDLKMEMPLEDALDQADTTDAMMLDFTEGDIISQSADGNTLTFVIKGEVMTAFFEESMADMMASLGGDATVEYSDVTYTVHLSENDEIKSLDAECSIIIGVMGEEAIADMLISMDVKQIGNVTIEYPDNLDDFMETDASMLF